MLIFQLLCAFWENLRVSRKQIAFSTIHEKNRGSRKPRAPRRAKQIQTRQDKARACNKSAWPCTQGELGRASQTCGMATRARQHDCVPMHGLAMLLGRTVRWSGRRSLNAFCDFCRAPFSSFVLFASRERLEGFMRVLDPCFRNEIVKIN